MTESADHRTSAGSPVTSPRTGVAVVTAAIWTLISLVVPEWAIYPFTGALFANRWSWPVSFDSYAWLPQIVTIVDALIIGLLAAGFTWLAIRLSGSPAKLWRATAFGAVLAFVLKAGFRAVFVSGVLGYLSESLFYTILREDVLELVFAVAGAYVGSRISSRRDA